MNHGNNVAWASLFGIPAGQTNIQPPVAKQVYHPLGSISRDPKRTQIPQKKPVAHKLEDRQFEYLNLVTKYADAHRSMVLDILEKASTAFDRLAHCRLLAKTRTWRIKNRSSSWLPSYLSDRFGLLNSGIHCWWP